MLKHCFDLRTVLPKLKRAFLERKVSTLKIEYIAGGTSKGDTFFGSAIL